MGENLDKELGEKVVEKLRSVMDPETYLDVLTMGLIKTAVKSVPGVRKVDITVIEFVDADSLNIKLQDCG